MSSLESDLEAGSLQTTITNFTIMTAGKVRKTRSLLDVPAEIWSKIGKHAVDAGGKYSPITTQDGMADTTRVARTSGYYQPAITRTCRVLREELLPYFYKNMIRLYIIPGVRGGHISLIGKWLRAVGGEHRRMIDGIYITVEEWEEATALRMMRQTMYFQVLYVYREGVVEDGKLKFQIRFF